jgi:hypothetical protein
VSANLCGMSDEPSTAVAGDMWIVIIGDHDKGLDGYGPFSGEDEAKRWATDQERGLGVRIVSIVTLRHPSR